jgi:hypothetical protein
MATCRPVCGIGAGQLSCLGLTPRLCANLWLSFAPQRFFRLFIPKFCHTKQNLFVLPDHRFGDPPAIRGVSRIVLCVLHFGLSEQNATRELWVSLRRNRVPRNDLHSYEFAVDSGADIVTSADDYRRYAEELLTLAKGAPDPGHKARLLEMAQAWRELAARSESGDAESGKPPDGRAG